jgi:vacuolar-type H+-ATPase subunit E/Vma4
MSTPDGKLSAANEEAKELLRQIHSATKELRRAERAAREACQEFDKRTAEALNLAIEHVVDQRVGAMLDACSDQLTAMVITTRQKIIDEFASLRSKLLQLDADPANQIPNLVERVAEQPGSGFMVTMPRSEARQRGLSG